MAGTYAHDAALTALINGTTTATTTGSAVQVEKPGPCAFRLTAGAVTGTSPTLDVEIQGSNDSAFGSGVVSYGHFDNLAGTAASVSEKILNASVYKRYVRAVATITGTTPSYASLKVTVEEPDYHRTVDTTA